MNNVTTPGGSEPINPIGNNQIKTYPNNLEREVSNIIGRNCVKVAGEDGMVDWVIIDASALTIELMEYIIECQKRKN